MSIPERNYYSNAPDAGQMYARIGKILINLAIYPSEKGFEYLRCAIVLTYHSPDITKFVSKTLYPKVARLCKCSSSANVGRSCRRSIETSYRRGYLANYYHGDTPPRCAEFVNAIAEYLHKNSAPQPI